MNRYYRCYNHKYWIIWLSFLVALILQIIPWSEQIYMYQPLWIFLILIYWLLELPHRINVGTSFVLGIIIDLLKGCVLGVHALAFSIIAYIVILNYQIFSKLSLWQQGFIMILLSFIMNIIVFCAEFLVLNISFQTNIFCSSVITGVFWPWLYLLMKKMHF